MTRPAQFEVCPRHSGGPSPVPAPHGWAETHLNAPQAYSGGAATTVEGPLTLDATLSRMVSSRAATGLGRLESR